MTEATTMPETQTTPAKPHLPDAQTVTSVKHWTDRLFSFRVTRPRSLRFRSGEFVMIGLMGDNGKPLLRAYSIASPAWDEELEFYSIKVPDGPLTSKLQHIQVGDEIILRPKPVGTLVHDALLPALEDGRLDSLRLIGDADAPNLIAQAVFAGHLAAREHGEQVDRDAVPFRRERWTAPTA